MEASAKRGDGEAPVNRELLTEYKPVSYASVQREMDKFRATVEEENQRWSEEIKLYEEMMEITIDEVAKPISVPRRNYANKERIVQDPRLFPYHSACYPLLDAYNALWEEDSDECESAVDKDANVASIPSLYVGLPVGRTSVTDDGSTYQPDHHLPCSEEAIETVFGRGCKTSGLLGPESFCQPCDETTPACDTRFGSESFPTRQDDMAGHSEILLKLLRHSMSDMQRDYRLASAVVWRLIGWNCCEDVNVYRRLWAILVEERVACDGSCLDRYEQDGSLEPPDHSCDHWMDILLPAIKNLLPVGIRFFSSEHADIISAIFQLEFDKTHAAAASMEETLIKERLGSSESQTVAEKQKMLLKRWFATLRYTEDEETEDDPEGSTEKRFPYVFLGELVDGLGHLALSYRKEIGELRRGTVTTADEADREVFTTWLLNELIDSFFNCLRSLVNIGELAVRRMANNQDSGCFCGKLVKSLVNAYVTPGESYYRDVFSHGADALRSNRYVERLVDAPHSDDHALLKSTTRDAMDVIRCLFARDMVVVEESGCGFGDVLVLLKQRISSLDPLLFFHSYNLPDSTSADNNDDDDDDDVSIRDEDGTSLTSIQLAARYDFSTMLLLRAWYAPWTKETHHTFGPPFRKAVQTLVLCFPRIGLPIEIAMTVCRYLSRDWWPEEKARCWCHECLRTDAVELLKDKMLQRVGEERAGLSVTQGKSEPLAVFSCPTCRIAKYRSTEHQKEDYQSGHLHQCGKPPFRIPGPEEEALCKQIFGESDGNSCGGVAAALADASSSLSQQAVMEKDDGSDDGSWESIDSDEEENDGNRNTTTAVLTRWFREKAYDNSRNVPLVLGRGD